MHPENKPNESPILTGDQDLTPVDSAVSRGALSNPDLRKLKALAQHLEPVLYVGKAGLSDGFYKSLEKTFIDHELVKVKFSAFKEEKKELVPQMVAKSGGNLVMRVGNVAVLYRAHPDAANRKILPV